MDKPKLKASEILKLQDNVKKLEKLRKCLSYLQKRELRVFTTELYKGDFSFSVNGTLPKSPAEEELKAIETYLSTLVAYYESIIPFEVIPEEKASTKRAVKRSFDDDEEDLEDDDDVDDGETESVYRL